MDAQRRRPGRALRHTAEACAGHAPSARPHPANRIDVGLGQVNLGYHAHRYEQPCDLLDPYRNLAIAAEILRSSTRRARTGWIAIGRYHRPAGGAPAARYRRSVHQHLTRVLGPRRPLPTLPGPHAMNRIFLAADCGAAGRHRRRAGPRSRHQEQFPAADRRRGPGGASALPYYQALNPQDAQPAPAAATGATMPRIGGPAEARAAMLPVRSVRSSPGDEPRRVIRAPGLTPLFLVGDDDRSRAWLKQRRPCRHCAPWAWWSTWRRPRHWPRCAASRQTHDVVAGLRRRPGATPWASATTRC